MLLVMHVVMTTSSSNDKGGGSKACNAAAIVCVTTMTMPSRPARWIIGYVQKLESASCYVGGCAARQCGPPPGDTQALL